MAKKNVIVVSLGNSGSGAVFDYLRSRKDMYTPFYGEEFRLFNDPQGIYSLYLNLYKNPGNNIYSFFVGRFIAWFAVRVTFFLSMNIFLKFWNFTHTELRSD